MFSYKKAALPAALLFLSLDLFIIWQSSNLVMIQEKTDYYNKTQHSTLTRINLQVDHEEYDDDAAAEEANWQLEKAWASALANGGMEMPNRTKYLREQYARNKSFVYTPEGYQNLLQKPFYVYEQLLWFDSRINNRQVITLLEENYTYKHADDVWFMASALTHPMRTLDPSKATLFVVPTLYTQAVSSENKYCWQGVCEHNRLLKIVEDFLQKSPWFQRKQGNDHIYVGSNMKSSRNMHLYPTLQKLHMIGMENWHYNSDDRFTMPSFYVGTPCPPATTTDQKSHDFALVATIKHVRTFKSRVNICTWTSNLRPEYTMPVCGSGNQCPALSDSKFGFHVRGDTFGANRLIDTILSETVPVFTQREQYMVLPDWIDWEQISAFADVTNRDSFLRDLDSLVNNTEQYEQKLAAVKANKDLLEWRSGIPFDTYMFMLLWHLEEASPGITPSAPVSSPYSALRLPIQQPFKAFQRSSKFLWCGIHGFAKSCSECGKTKHFCTHSCQICPNGSALEPIVNGTKRNICVPSSHTCRPKTGKMGQRSPTALLR